ncbi:MAG: hypothetical protein DRQ61_05775 [Gammaproteobacteria bacterium]|nr:MAG: hypothetical protein DRQ61_05775 [Gammaproteobacteria bacterium]
MRISGIMTSKEKWFRTMQQGQHDFQKGNLSSAVKFFSLATEISPSRVEGWVNLGVSQVEAGYNQAALVALQQAISLAPNIMPAHMALGDAQRFLGNFDSAFIAYQQAVELQRTPMSLNKLAAIQRARGNPEKAEALFHEALRLAPGFTLARVNLATVQVDLQNFDEANKQLNDLEGLPLSLLESEEVNSTRISLDIYNRLQPSIDSALREGDLVPMKKALLAIPENLLQADEEILEGIRGYANSALSLSPPKESGTCTLPNDWPLIEALFMIPYVESVDAFLKTKEALTNGIKPAGDLLESINMERVVSAARSIHFEDLLDPIKAEMHSRHWHALATVGVEKMLPGQFKMVKNMSHSDTLKRRAEPHLVTGTFRQFISEIYAKLPPGLLRGLVVMMAVSDMHAFPDGNGRIALAWMNRELEAVGQIPAIFTHEGGFKGGFAEAMREARSTGGDLSSLVSVTTGAQQYSQDFCDQLRRK